MYLLTDTLTDFTSIFACSI